MRRHPCESGVNALTRNRRSHENGYQSNRVPSKPSLTCPQNCELPPGEWIEANTVAIRLGWTIGRLEFESRQLGIKPHCLSGHRRFYRPSDVQRLNGGRPVARNDFPLASRQQPAFVAESIEYPAGYIAPTMAAHLLHVHVSRVKYVAAELGIGVIRINRPGKFYAYSREDVHRALRETTRRERGAR